MRGGNGSPHLVPSLLATLDFSYFKIELEVNTKTAKNQNWFAFFLEGLVGILACGSSQMFSGKDPYDTFFGLVEETSPTEISKGLARP